MKKICTDCEKEFDPVMSFCLQCGKLLKPSDIAEDRIVNCNFEYKCPLEWDTLLKTGNGNIRFCKSCEKDVHFAHTQTELYDLAAAGNCVAFHKRDTWYAPEVECVSEPQSLMGIIVSPERMEELKSQAEHEKRRRAETKSWWKFWK